MTVDPAHSAGSHVHDGTTYHFCSTHCLHKFKADPPKYLAGHREEMGHAHAPPPPGVAVKYICPMDPEVVSDRPGACPKCGMALEPAVPTDDSGPDPEERMMRNRFWIGLVLGVPLLIIAMADMLPSHPVSSAIGMRAALLLQWALATPIVFWCGWPFFERAWTAWKQRHFNMFTLIAIGVAAAYALSVIAALLDLIGIGGLPAGLMDGHGMVVTYFESAGTIVVLVLAGQLLEGRARRHTGQAIRGLLQLAPKTARLIAPDGREVDTPVELLQKGDRIRVRPGERVSVDGVVREGSTQIDESMLTGEPIPVEKGVGATVSAGTLNGNGPIVVETVRSGGDTLLARIVHLVGTAQRSRMPVQATVDKVAAWFVPAVLAAAVITIICWIAFGSGSQRYLTGLLNAVTVLIIACPCALGLATPMAVVVGMGRGASMGVLFRSAESLERLGQINTLVFDKTGTLTEGKPQVTHVETVEGISPDELLRRAASLERASEHPLAAALVKAAEAKGLSLTSAQDVRVVPGKGISGIVDGQPILIGNAAFLLENHIESDASRRRLEDLREEAHTVLLVAVGGSYAGLIAVRDPIRNTTVPAVRQLQAEGVRLVVLTGDNRSTANAVARQIGVTEVLSDVLPTDKHAHIKKLQEGGGAVAMAGDGINDAPALAQADVGIAMGSGADVAIESAGVTLVRPDLSVLVSARKLSQATMSTIRQNLALAFLYNVLAIPVAAGLLVAFGGPVIGPVWAAAAMSLSSLSVVGNSLRLRTASLK